MERRSFLRSIATVPAVFALTPRVPVEDQEPPPGCPTGQDQKLAGLSLTRLRDQYRRDLFDDFLPFMDKYVIDRQYGGFMCDTGMDGAHSDENKRAWYEGRGIWVYSFLYQHLAREEEFLEVARRAVEFILKARPAGEDSVWPRDLTRDGRPLTPGEIYGDLFIAEGLAEYSAATGELRFRELAKQIILKCVRLYDRPDFRPESGQSYLGPEAPPFPGARAQGTWMVLIRILTPMVSRESDGELEEILARAVDAVTNYHYNPEFRLNNELLNHDLSRPTNLYGQLVYTGHVFETTWMILAEALRTRNRALLDQHAERLRRHVELSWDRVYGGVFQNLKHVDQNVWVVEKELWPQEEVLIGALLLLEHTGDPWARETFSRMFQYVQEKYPLRRYGSPLWIHASDRKVSFEAYSRMPKRVENYHHPRHLMLNLLALERMIRRGGQPAATPS